MARDERDFLARWSRLKREAEANPEVKPAAGAPAGQPPDLPAVDKLTPESDFKVFMHAKVKDSVRREALKKLFADPRFNVMDRLDVYIDDYTIGETISPEMLAQLEHSKSTLNPPRPESDDTAKEQDVPPGAAVAANAEPAQPEHGEPADEPPPGRAADEVQGEGKDDVAAG